MAKKTVKEAIQELWYWQYGTNPTNFTSRLFELMQHADGENRALLSAAFPMEHNALTLWLEAPDPEKFFNTWGYGLKKRG